MSRGWLVGVVLGLASAVSAQPEADAHLLAGAREFREGRYTEALVEFRVAEKLGAGPQVRWYVASTLQKLERNEEALEAFALAEAAYPEGRDPVLSYYEAVASHDARLYVRADHLLAKIEDSAGPRIAGQARQLRRQLLPLLRATPTAAQVDFYLDRARSFGGARRTLAQLYLSEARALARRSTPCDKCGDVDRVAEELEGSRRGAMVR